MSKNNVSIENLEKIAKGIRKKIFKMAYKAGGAHIGGAYSAVEILTTLYFGGILKYDAKNPLEYDRDRFILSKGHASSLLYVILNQAGFFDEDILYSYCKPGGVIGGHPKIQEVPGVEATTGSLGHGLLFSSGIALAGKLNKKDYRVYCLVGDGECQEGSVWEAALFAPQRKLGNLTVIVDYNKLQAMDELEKIISMKPFADKWRAFGWDVVEVDGHNIKELLEVFSQERDIEGKPRLILANTVKGKGVSFMEGKPLWHYRMPNEEELEILLEELEMTKQELI